MTTINLTSDIIRAYLGNKNYRGCQDIEDIFCRDATNNGEIKVMAKIPASSTRQGSYSICVEVTRSGDEIKRTTCTCPILRKCKHIAKILHRIRESRHIPIPGPSKKVLELEAKAQRYSDKLNHASVYVAIACKSELDSGSDFRRSMFVKDNVDQEILGLFFSLKAANQCARDHLAEIEDENGDDEDDEDDGMGLDSDDEDYFCYDG